jgi:hypothetical protein
MADLDAGRPASSCSGRILCELGSTAGGCMPPSRRRWTPRAIWGLVQCPGLISRRCWSPATLSGRWNEIFPSGLVLHVTTIDAENGSVVHVSFHCSFSMSVTIRLYLVHGDAPGYLGWAGHPAAGRFCRNDSLPSAVISNNYACQASYQGYGAGSTV